ncbi:MAG TPA: hypothetical protein VGM27_00215 [Acidobacteriaceae bacterium]
MKTIRSFIYLLFLLSTAGFAQETQSEVGFQLGVDHIPESTTAQGASLRFGNSITFSAAYARHLVGNRTSLAAEIPFAASPSHSVTTANAGRISSLASLYVTPSLRLKFLSGKRVSPWFSAGFGYGLYQGSAFFNNGTKNTNVFRNTAAAQFGGGVDFQTPLRILFPISLRAEIRDFHTLDTPSFGVPVGHSTQDNIITSGGFVIHF